MYIEIQRLATSDQAMLAKKGWMLLVGGQASLPDQSRLDLTGKQWSFCDKCVQQIYTGGRGIATDRDIPPDAAVLRMSLFFFFDFFGFSVLIYDSVEHETGFDMVYGMVWLVLQPLVSSTHTHTLYKVFFLSSIRTSFARQIFFRTAVDCCSTISRQSVYSSSRVVQQQGASALPGG